MKHIFKNKELHDRLFIDFSAQQRDLIDHSINLERFTIMLANEDLPDDRIQEIKERQAETQKAIDYILVIMDSIRKQFVSDKAFLKAEKRYARKNFIRNLFKFK